MLSIELIIISPLNGTEGEEKLYATEIKISGSINILLVFVTGITFLAQVLY